eukprot:5748958-Heterocapsa_arctica.AAC.1
MICWTVVAQHVVAHLTVIARALPDSLSPTTQTTNHDVDRNMAKLDYPYCRQILPLLPSPAQRARR